MTKVMLEKRSNDLRKAVKKYAGALSCPSVYDMLVPYPPRDVLRVCGLSWVRR